MWTAFFCVFLVRFYSNSSVCVYIWFKNDYNIYIYIINVHRYTPRNVLFWFMYVCILYVYCMYIVCILYVYCMYIVCILYVYCMYIVCILYVYCMYIVCILYHNLPPSVVSLVSLSPSLPPSLSIDPRGERCSADVGDSEGYLGVWSC